VVKLAAGSDTRQILGFTGLEVPGKLAIGSTGNASVIEQLRHRVVELAASSGTQRTLPFNLSPDLVNPGGLAVDSAGNVYVTDTFLGHVVELPSAGGAQRVLPSTGLNRPSGLAVDPADNLYVIDAGNNRVLKLTPQ
jgi:serine/threonine protein kinase, bacterial